MRRLSFLRYLLIVCTLLLAMSGVAFGDGIFVSGHDPDFHASLGGNALGAQHIIQDALGFTRGSNAAPILLIESNTDNVALGDHTDSETGLIDSGYTASSTPGNHYVKVSASTFSGLTLAQLETYSSIFIPSDHGGTLTGDDLQALDARSADIIKYLNNGGGLVAFAEDGFHTPQSSGPAPALFGFLPFLVSSTAFEQSEVGNTLDPAGTALGLTTSDINGNASHNIFTSTGGMNVVDRDSQGHILSLDFQGQITPGGTTPEPATILLLLTGVAGLGYKKLRK